MQQSEGKTLAKRSKTKNQKSVFHIRFLQLMWLVKFHLYNNSDYKNRQNLERAVYSNIDAVSGCKIEAVLRQKSS